MVSQLQLPRGAKAGTRHGKKAPVDEFLPDSRVEVIWDRLQGLRRQLKLPEETYFATEVQPEKWVEGKNGISVLQPEQVIFWAVCPNPQPRWKDKLIKHFASMSIADWRKAEAEKWRFAGMPDPAFVIFRGLLHELGPDYQHWSEIN